ncbi:DUF397 domain-containing protein [Streptomonospora salina]|uniref:DUF397 domain-containing protein n=1 Tax=Streptomonospora salina TaxID=104205 RepID=A0A841E0J4_9ACTN|nr:DUF397 domain-containing protein [Streptomonospora salina]MBB5996576.1 hypothetical protein [Streptomonospora salina]
MSDWHTSSYSPNGSNCVEVRETPETVDVRDTQNRAVGHLTFDAAEWTAFLDEVRSGRL